MKAYNNSESIFILQRVWSKINPNKEFDMRVALKTHQQKGTDMDWLLYSSFIKTPEVAFFNYQEFEKMRKENNISFKYSIGFEFGKGRYVISDFVVTEFATYGYEYYDCKEKKFSFIQEDDLSNAISGKKQKEQNERVCCPQFSQHINTPKQLSASEISRINKIAKDLEKEVKKTNLKQNEIEMIVRWFKHIEQLATDRKNSNGWVMTIDECANEIRVLAKDSAEYVEKWILSRIK